MSLERVLKILENFGFARVDAEVYVYLAKKGPKREEDLTSALKLATHQLCSSLKDLQSKGMVTSTVEKSTLFSAVAFERVLDLLVKANIEQARVISETREKLIAGWRTSLKREYT